MRGKSLLKHAGIVLALLVALGCCFALCACDDGNTPASPVVNPDNGNGNSGNDGNNGDNGASSEKTITVYLPVSASYSSTYKSADGNSDYSDSYSDKLSRDSNARITHWERDYGGSVLSKDYTYNADGQVITFVNSLKYDGGSMSNTRSFEYSNGKLSTVSLSYPGESRSMTQTYSYDGNGRLSSTLSDWGDWKSSVDYSYGPNGISSVDEGSYNIASYKYSAGLFSYFDVQGKASDGSRLQVSLSYDTNGNVSGATGKYLYNDGESMVVGSECNSVYQLVEGHCSYAEMEGNGNWCEASANVSYDSNTCITKVQVNRSDKNGNRQTVVYTIGYQAYQVPESMVIGKNIQCLLIEPSYDENVFELYYIDPSYQAAADLPCAADPIKDFSFNDFVG